MTHTTMREIHGDEMAEVIYTLATPALNPSPPLPDKAERQEIIKKRQGVTCFALYEEDTPVACVASTAMTQNVRGALYGMGGIWGVATATAARRQGYSRHVLARLLAALRERGQPLSGLYPFRESFYENLGYVTFPQPRKVGFAPAPLLPLLKRNLGGEVQQLLSSDGFDAYRDYLLQMRERVHGVALFDHPDRDRAQRNPVWLALARVDGKPVGVMLYDLKGDAPTEFKMRVFRFYYVTSQGKYLLLAWIARHTDQANSVEMTLPPYELPETWMADLSVKPEPIFRAPMGRVVDVAGIGSMGTGPGRFAARVTDPLCSWNERVWKFETVDGAIEVAETGAADCELTIQGLAALIYGTHDPADFSMRGWGDPSPGLQGTMRAMFPPRLPHLHEFF
jgi:predicted acetyltransferase